MKRRTFIRTSACSVAALAILGTNTQVYAADRAKKNITLKTPHGEEPFHLGMAGWTFHKFDLQKTLDRELKNRTNYPFSNDVPKDEIDRLMRNGRRWSDRYTSMKKAGVSESDIMKSFDVPTQMMAIHTAKSRQTGRLVV